MSNLAEIVHDVSVQGGIIEVAVSYRSAVRGPDGDYVFPPTYAGEQVGQQKGKPRYTMSPPNDQGISARILLESRQAFSTRIEQALLDAGAVPDIQVHVGGDVLSLPELPHRAYDAYIRDSVLDGIPWFASPVGEAIRNATPKAAEAMYRRALEGGLSPDDELYGAIRAAKIVERTLGG